ncbi:TRP-domain-containing protein [Massarina eburnea CBS 473.64]|uniref:TRP-domain-containing protein n=1 Tax=Massarina eburnea CBS 473.64 TaxID=1395130 RepID=A0A6A6RVJ2_9PLEO|nr:TRP-domain-containing protein [Massarina eburnea CBS 473.64]
MIISVLELSWVIVLLIFSLPRSVAANRDGYVNGIINGVEYLVRDNRRPSLYTQDYGSCMSGGNITVNRFDAAYYKDNMTVLFHLGGETTLQNETIMMYISVYAYGESRFDLIFNPCDANIDSACPIQASVPIEANGNIPISLNDVSGIPPLALEIPDFEGQAILRIFSNSTESEIACFTAALTNGNSFSQPEWVSSVLGIFTFVALLSSFATATYGDNTAEIRKHYAHSLSVSVVFAVWQYIYFSGALSMNWPSVLVAFWSNYAWAGGMIYSEAMQNTISSFIGSNKGTTTTLGAAGVGIGNPDLGGGFDIHDIYQQGILSTTLNVPSLVKRNKYNLASRHLEEMLTKREAVDTKRGWYGNPVSPGILLPGNYSGFAGTLAQNNIPTSNAFMTGFLWFLVLLALVAVSVVGLKILLESLSFTRMMKRNRLTFFRDHFLEYTALAVLRILYIGFFVLVFLSLFQFTYLASPAPVAVACVVFLMMLVGLGGLAGYACVYRIRHGEYITKPDRLHLVKCKVMKFVPFYTFECGSKFPHSEDKIYAGSLPWWRICPVTEMKSIHDDEEFTKKFGWLASRFRRTRWWFFAVWLIYEFIRACFLAGAARQPMIQVFGLIVVEFVAFVGIIVLRPFEGQRLNLLVVYGLGFSKIATLALSAALDVRFGLPRIPATVLAIVIIVIQGLLTIVTLIAIVVGAATSYMSVMRNREIFHPTRWIPVRERYFHDMDFRVKDVPRPPPTPQERNDKSACVPVSEIPKEPHFNVKAIRRMAKIEDEDHEFLNEIRGGEYPASQLSLSQQSQGAIGNHFTQCRVPSIRSQMSYSNLPYGARVHRASWSTMNFSDPYLSGCRLNGSSSTFNTPDSGKRFAGRTTPPFNTRLTESSGNILQQQSPASTIDPFATPVPSPATTSSSSRTIPRPKSWRSSRSSSATRPRLQTVHSENEVPQTPKLS